MSVSRFLIPLVILIACSSCASQNQGKSETADTTFSQNLAREKHQALAIVESRRDAKRTAKEFPGESWSVESEYEDAMASDDSDHTYCPHEYDVYYGEPGSDPDANVWQWHVNVALKKAGAGHSWAWMLSFTPSPQPSPGFEEGDRLSPCWDGKLPAVAFPDSAAGEQ